MAGQHIDDCPHPLTADVGTIVTVACNAWDCDAGNVEDAGRELYELAGTLRVAGRHRSRSKCGVDCCRAVGYPGSVSTEPPRVYAAAGKLGQPTFPVSALDLRTIVAIAGIERARRVRRHIEQWRARIADGGKADPHHF